MSEYQYYEFLAVDRRLTQDEMHELRSISSRAQITPTHFVNEYNWGDFKGDEFEFLTHYFDLHVYFANWGTHRFMVRVPSSTLSDDDVKPYCGEYEFTHRKAGKALILDFNSSDDEGGDWEEEEGWMASLAPVRDELLRGDRRALYLGWLMRVQMEEVDEDAIEPPVPAGLGALSGPLTSLAEFLRIDQDLITAAGERSGELEEADTGLAEWIAALPAKEKDRLLLEMIAGTDLSLGSKLLARFRTSQKKVPKARSEGRTVGELLEAAEQIRIDREAAEAKRAAEVRARKTAADAKARKKHLDKLATRQDEAWRHVLRLVAEQKAKAYDEAVTLLVDLREVADHSDERPEFDERVMILAGKLSPSSALLARLKKAKLVGPR